MNNTLNKAAEKLNALAIRERIFVGIAVLALIFVFWDLIFRADLEMLSKKLDTDIKSTEEQLRTINIELATIKELQKKDPDKTNKALKVKLDFEIAQLNERLKQLTFGIIDPKRMMEILEEMLVKNSELEFVRVQNLVGEPLINRDEDTSSSEKEAIGDVFRHGVMLEFKGRYLSTLRYLKSLENLPWRFYWGDIRYTVEEYPIAHVTIVVYTLSLNEKWIGV